MPVIVTFQPLTIKTWPSFEKLFGPKGACGGCWCMTWRLQKADFEKHEADANKEALHFDIIPSAFSAKRMQHQLYQLASFSVNLKMINSVIATT